MRKGPLVRTGALPYDDGSGFQVEIAINEADERYPNGEIELNPDSEFCHFDVEDWPEVRAAIDRAVHALKMLTP